MFFKKAIIIDKKNLFDSYVLCENSDAKSINLYFQESIMFFHIE